MNCIQRRSTPAVLVLAGVLSACHGEGGAQALEASVSPETLAFSAPAPGTASVSGTVTISNMGTSALIVSRVSVSGRDADVFAAIDACEHPIATKESCTVTVTYRRTTSSTTTAYLDVTTNPGSAPTVVWLYGSGFSPGTSPLTLLAGHADGPANTEGLGAKARRSSCDRNGAADLLPAWTTATAQPIGSFRYAQRRPTAPQQRARWPAHRCAAPRTAQPPRPAAER